MRSDKACQSEKGHFRKPQKAAANVQASMVCIDYMKCKEHARFNHLILSVHAHDLRISQPTHVFDAFRAAFLLMGAWTPLLCNHKPQQRTLSHRNCPSHKLAGFITCGYKGHGPQHHCESKAQDSLRTAQSGAWTTEPGEVQAVVHKAVSASPVGTEEATDEA